jgi:osmotically-inducible protein OsmY
MSPAISLQDEVLKELRFDPRLDASKIGVTVTPNGVVTLTGTVSTYMEKLAAEEAAKRVHGVRAVANDIEVVISGAGRRTDTEIAESALNAVKARSAPLDSIKVIVKNGWVTLEGEVDYYFQKQEAERAIAPLAGVKGVTNNIRVRPRPVNQEEIKKQIEEALVRSARLDAQNITVRIEGSKAILEGSVRSWAEREEAENAAWAVPGILEVENNLRIVP